MNTVGTKALLKINVIIPLCNEEESLPILGKSLGVLQGQLAANYNVHYIFVDDGSTDRTVLVLPDSIPSAIRYTLVSHGRNRGVGAALRTGFQNSRDADLVCTIDADCTYGPEHLVQMIHQVRSGKSDVVVASPYHPSGTVEGVQPWRMLLSRQCSRLYRIVSPLKLYTYTSMFRVYPGSFVRRASIRRNDFISIVELILSASALGYSVSEMPLTLRKRSAGVSKMKILKTIQGHATLMFECLRNRATSTSAGNRLLNPSRKEPFAEASGSEGHTLQADPKATTMPRTKGVESVGAR
jgi:dolichol-phosphate mannosyltransferase